HRISVSGPGKTDSCLSKAKELRVQVIHVDSLDELHALGHPGTCGIGLRLPSADGQSGKLGLTAMEMEQAIQTSPVPLWGLHSYLGRERFSKAQLSQSWESMAQLISRFPTRFQTQPRLALGPGLPARWQSDAEGASHASLGSSMPCDFEVGRGLLAAAGYYATPVLARKATNFGDETVIVNGGLQHLGSPFVTATQKLTDIQAICVRAGQPVQEETKTFAIYGSLCLGHDVLHPRLPLPRSLRRGDWIVFPLAGAYGLTGGVPHFIGQDLPTEWIYENGRLRDVTAHDFRLYHDSFWAARPNSSTIPL
ncbi:MAG: hypothetical protein NDI61_12300, partial [Bdellovibrionaceae bacterium]|nr:hypothetical protein [Pseudobdellovibrionaceae bacterium]